MIALRLLTIGSVALTGPHFALARETAEGDTNVDEALAQRREQIQTAMAEPTLTGQWFGAGPWLQDRGIRLEAACTGFFSRTWSGPGQDQPGDGGKFDALLRVDAGKLGLWEGLSLMAHSEYNFGHSLNGAAGTVLPVNLAMQLPGAVSGSRYDTSSLFLTQKFNDTFSLILGKTNLADLAALHPYAGGAGLTGFMNGALAAAPNGAVPPYVHGGALVAKTDAAVWSFAVYGGTTAKNGLQFQEAFDDGYLLSATVRVPVNPGGQPGVQSLSMVWGERELGDLRKIGDLLPPGAAQGLGKRDTERLLLQYSFHQQVGCWGGDPDRGWGVWGRAQWTDQELTPVAWSVAVGIGGTSPIPGREDDRWGAGGFYYTFSDYLGDDRFVNVPLDDEFGAEVFYRVRLTDWLSMTGDLQLVESGLPDADLVVLGGIRTLVRF